ncbi:MAG: hypothetical protein ACK47N_07090 [Microcystis sp.]
MATSKPVKPHTPHPTPHTLPPPKNFFSRPYLGRLTCLDAPLDAVAQIE